MIAMSKVRIRFTGGLGRVAGQKEFDIAISKDEPLGKLLIDLVERIGCELKEALIEPRTNALCSGVVVSINGAIIAPNRAMKTIVKPGDNVLIIPFVEGG
jgi:thiamine biosynthesis protein ThiS